MIEDDLREAHRSRALFCGQILFIDCRKDTGARPLQGLRSPESIDTDSFNFSRKKYAASTIAIVVMTSVRAKYP